MALGVGLGAFGAHGLRNIVTPARLETWETAVFYHMVHALGVLVTALLLHLAVEREGQPAQRWATRAGACFLGGIGLFSGSLYILVLSDLGWMGAITPLGGVAFILGWIAVTLWARHLVAE